MRWWQIVLFPFSILYDLVTRFRNHLYNIGYKKSFEFEVNVISVGNLSVGGTGKTPMVSYLAQYLLNKGLRIATLSRGYGRKTKGFRICSNVDTPETVGDEPYTYFEQYGSQIVVAVGEDRALAIPFILAEHSDIDVILLDDAFQHRTVIPSFSILLTTAERPFWKDYVLPSGLLRESRKGANRSNTIIVTKSKKPESYPALDLLQKPYFQTSISYGYSINFFGEQCAKEVVIVCGLANNQPFIKHVKQNYSVVHIFSFKDHHHFTSKDIDQISSKLGKATLITTHKDAVKLKQFDQLQSFNCAYVPIKVEFLAEEERFLQMVDESLKDYSINQ